ncbi:hypothetical protein A6B43_04540 [Vespertiliibacter pulmonis]|uniref:Glutaredoxin-related protein n=1 Tax=Vespertiliibacter pulmonis TaxID=1443036 RepID=A0A3N4WE17_9PAST|nr:hypothetical protein [Vespertiliibacter pulmonis]QLB20843.1 hypothetical protein A6B43_04540 [Vespertiliibacter pulmonis]RPE83494.1 glutaredoxin-related protein [Vespertiliibacter pulmonis]
MTKPVLFFAQLCPDTQPFIEKLKALNIEYEAVEIMSSLANLKRFLALRDHHAGFEHAKQQGFIGIPALLLENEKIILDLANLK